MRWSVDAGEDGEATGTNGRSRGGSNRRLGLATGAAARASIPANGGDLGGMAMLKWSTGRGESNAVLRIERGGLLFIAPR